MTPATIRPMRADEGPACERVLRALPDWFGIEESLREYVRDTAVDPTWVAESGGEVVGFATLHTHFPVAAEIHCIAVVPEHHRSGLGRMLVEQLVGDCRLAGVRVLQVKTRPRIHPVGRAPGALAGESLPATGQVHPVTRCGRS
jgi:N-acetylglutamate synthase-like GNAT family acetyltransferase